MYLFFRLFNTGIPWTVIIITLFLAACVHTYLYYKRRMHYILPWIVAYLFLMLYATVIGRIIDGSWETSHESGVHLMPFWSIQAIKDGYIETLYEKIYNVLFFVPYGVLLKSLTPSPSPEGKGDRKAYPRPRKIGEWISGIRELGKKKKPLPNPLLKGRESIREGKGGRLGRVVLIGFLTSVAIEVLQLITRTGMCETDDVICNTIGCAVGAGMTIWISGIRELWNEGRDAESRKG